MLFLRIKVLKNLYLRELLNFSGETHLYHHNNIDKSFSCRDHSVADIMDKKHGIASGRTSEA